MNTIYIYTADGNSNLYKKLLQAKVTGDISFARVMANDINAVMNFPQNALALLPEGILSKHMGNYLPVRSLVVPKLYSTHHTKTFGRQQRFALNPYFIPPAYGHELRKASCLIIIDDLSVTGSTLHHISSLIARTGKPTFAVVWLKLITQGA